MKIATWNVNSLSVRLPQVLDWLSAQKESGGIDVLALQELKLSDDKFPIAALQEAGYQAHWFGQKTYNGVALISPATGTEVVKNIPGFEDEMSRVIAATYPDGAGGTVRVIGAYFPNGQAPDSDKFVYKMRWLDALRDWVDSEMQQHPNLVLLGDYNITFDELDMWDPVGLKDTIHCTVAEREKLQALTDLGLTDSFRLFEQPEKSYSWWDYREFAFRRNRGLRIDHILISQALKARASACVIDRAPRKNERPSDHAPVVMTLD
jgi:exodeoxyribonuclease-3